MRTRGKQPQPWVPKVLLGATIKAKSLERKASGLTYVTAKQQAPDSTISAALPEAHNRKAQVQLSTEGLELKQKQKRRGMPTAA